MATDTGEQLVQAILGGLAGDLVKHAQEANAKFWEHQDLGIDRLGSKIILPSEPRPMGIEEAITFLQRRLEEENQVMDVQEFIDAFPFDAAVALTWAMKDTYGWAQAVPTPSFFGDIMPDIKTVRTGPDPGDTTQVVLGSFIVPGISKKNGKPNPIRIVPHRGGPRNKMGLVVIGSVRHKERTILMDLIEKARSRLQTHSIYKGKALRIKVTDEGQLVEGAEPDFIQTKHVREEELILDRETEALVRVSLFTPIQHTQQCVDREIPLKRGVLLEGPFGTGKSMTAAVTSKVCVDNGWTYILLDNPRGLKEAVEFAVRYQPAVVFTEDIDRVMEDRDDETSDLLNTVDGVLTKNAKVIIVYTTNFVERINRAMLRPGRLDAVISIAAPDAEASTRLVKLYARNLLKEGETLDELGSVLKGQIPATIREVVERSKLAMIGRGDTHLTEGDLIIAAKGMERHLKLLNGPGEEPKTAEQRLGEALGEIMRDRDTERVADSVDELSSTVGGTYQEAVNTRQVVQKIRTEANDAAERNSDVLKAIARTVGARVG